MLRSESSNSPRRRVTSPGVRNVTRRAAQLLSEAWHEVVFTFDQAVMTDQVKGSVRESLRNDSQVAKPFRSTPLSELT